MADETITTKATTEIKTSIEGINDSIEDGLEGFQEFTKTVVDGSEDADKALNKLLKTVARMTKTIRPAVKEFNNFDKIVEDTEKSVKTLGLTYAKALVTGNKQFMVATTAVAQTSLALQAASRQVKIASDHLGKMSDGFKEATIEVIKANTEVAKLEAQHKSLKAEIDATTAVTEDEIKALEEKKLVLGRVAVELGKHRGLVAENSAAAKQFEVDSIKAAMALKKEQVAMIEANKALIDRVAAERQHNRELRRMAGGATAVTAAFEEVMDTKFFDYFKKAGSLALVGASFALLIKSMNQVSDHAKATQRIALSLGDAGETGFGRLAKSAEEAQAEVSKLRDLTYRFGYTAEEMTDTMNKVRAGIRMDREGRLTSAAIQDMTQEVTAFARITGTDLDASFQLMEKRVKQFGMTSAEAVGSIQDMRTTLHQMVPDTNKNTIAMAEMVNIIEEASAASQSYIVDTRIMTQALRGAVNQAEHLGVAQKQAKDVAQATGKILSNAPDFIKIPAGLDLVNQLMGKDADNLLNTLDAGTHKQAVAIQQALKAGKLDYFVGAKALMDLIGQTDAGLEAQSKHLEATILQGPAAAELIAKQYGIENRATAFMVTNMMQEAVAMRNSINAATGKQTITFATAMVKDAALFDAMVEKTNLDSADAKKQLIKEMQDKGLSEDQANEYIATYQKGLKDTSALQEQLAAERAKGDAANAETLADLEKQLYMAKFGDKTVALNKSLRPVQAILGEIGEKQKKLGEKVLTRSEVTGKVTLDTKALEKANIRSGADLAKRLGIDYSKASDGIKTRLDNMYKNGTTPEDMEAIKREISSTSQKQLAAADDYATKTPAEKTVHWLQNIFARLGWLGPLTGIAAGIVGMAAGIALLYRGQKNAQFVANWVRMNSDALPVRMLGAGGPAGPAGPTNTTTTDSGKKTWKERAQAGKARASAAAKSTWDKTKAFGKTRTGKTAAIGLAAFGAYQLLKSKDAKAAESPETAESAGATAPKSTFGEKVDTGLMGAGAAVGTAALVQRFGPAALKVGKMARAVPLAGNVIAAGFAVKQAWDLYEKWKEDPNSITASDKVRMGMALAGMVPGIGNAIMMADIGADMTGGYNLLDDVTRQKTMAGNIEAKAARLAGTPTGMPDLEAPRSSLSATRTFAMAGAAAAFGGGLSANVNMNSLTPDGALTLKVNGWQDVMAQLNKAQKSLTT
jgi:DNA-binding ferritin-like protein (Dps family)